MVLFLLLNGMQYARPKNGGTQQLYKLFVSCSKRIKH